MTVGNTNRRSMTRLVIAAFAVAATSLSMLLLVQHQDSSETSATADAEPSIVDEAEPLTSQIADRAANNNDQAGKPEQSIVQPNSTNLRCRPGQETSESCEVDKVATGSKSATDENNDATIIAGSKSALVSTTSTGPESGERPEDDAMPGKSDASAAPASAGDPVRPARGSASSEDEPIKPSPTDTPDDRAADLQTNAPQPRANAGCVGAPQLPSASGPIVNINDERSLQEAVKNVTPSTTILIAPGTYKLSSTLWVKQPNVTIRGTGQDCRAVTLQGPGMDNSNYGDVPHGIWTDKPGLTVQNMTIRDVYYHPIALNHGAEDPKLVNLQLLDAGEQFIKSSAGPAWGDGVNRGLIEHVTAMYTNGTPRTDHGGGTGYTQGLSVHGGRDWVIRNSLFRNFHTRDGDDHRFNPVVLMWRGSRNTVVEGNVFVDVDRAVAFGLSEEAEGAGHAGGRIANNMIYQSPGLFSATRRQQADAPIIVWGSPQTSVDHNTCVTSGNSKDCIQFRFDTSGAVARNNLIDRPVTARNGAPFSPSNNRKLANSNVFAGLSSGDLHLTTSDSQLESLEVPRLVSTPTDADGNRRSQVTIAGADQP